MRGPLPPGAGDFLNQAAAGLPGLIQAGSVTEVHTYSPALSRPTSTAHVQLVLPWTTPLDITVHRTVHWPVTNSVQSNCVYSVVTLERTPSAVPSLVTTCLLLVSPGHFACMEWMLASSTVCPAPPAGHSRPSRCLHTSPLRAEHRFLEGTDLLFISHRPMDIWFSPLFRVNATTDTCTCMWSPMF